MLTPIHELNGLLANIPAARLFEEYCKLFLTGNAFATYALLNKYGLFKQLFPRTAQFLTNNAFIATALRNTDKRLAQGKSVAPSFLLAVFGWQPLHALAATIDLQDAMDQVIREQQRIMAVPRAFCKHDAPKCGKCSRV